LRIVCKPISIAGFASEGEVSVVVSEDLTSHLDGLDLNIRSDYYSSFNRANPVSYKVSAEEYLFGRDEKWADKTMLCPEMPIPSYISSSVRLAAPTKTCWTKQAVALIHAGRLGSIAPLHFDWDHKWIAHACLIGRKRIFIFPPEAGWLLSPVINTSALRIPKFSESDRREILDKLGGIEVSLEGGQGVLLPSMFWHGVLYEEPSLSISIRFEPYPGGRPFAVLPRSWLLQRLVWWFFQRGYGDEADKFLTECLRSFFIKKSGWKGRYRRLAALYRQALLDRGEQRGTEQLVSESFSAEMLLALQELKLYYGDSPEVNLTANDEAVKEAAEYIFEAFRHPLGASELRLASHALRVRQGLPPKRGLIEIERENEN
jgi:hypothetical protein